MKTLIDVLPWMLDHFTWIRDFEINQWREIMVIYENSKCKLCGKVVETGTTCLANKGIGILHDPCFESCCEWATIRDNNLIAMQQRIFNYYKSVK